MSAATLETFIKKYQTARNFNSKELRITLQEADEMASEIALLLTGINTLNAKIISLQDQLLMQKQEINVSGGSFSV